MSGKTGEKDGGSKRGTKSRMDGRRSGGKTGRRKKHFRGGFTENALTVLKKRYLAKDEEGKPVETPEELFRRVARNVSLIDILYHEEVFDKNGEQPVHSDHGEGAEGFGPYSVREVLEEARDLRVGGVQLTVWDLQTLYRGYMRLNREGKMKAEFRGVLHALRRHLSEVERSQKELYDMMTSLEFCFNSPTLMNAGRELQQLSACFVLPIDDSLPSIFESLKSAALIHQSGGGTGFSFSRLRPKDDIVRSTGGVASGPVSFLRVYNAATEAVRQGGTRRGANMGILRVDHPDILEFISCKQDNRDITNFNISVALTEDFMKAVDEGREYELVNPRTGLPVKRLNAREVFDKIVEMAWKNGEPGIMFLDRMNADNPTPRLGEIESTNPCGEQPLLPYESCNLGSINLGLMVDDGRVDFERLSRVTSAAVRYLDNIIDANRYPLEEIERMTWGNRKIGLGVMGFADLLVGLGIPYDSEQAVEVARDLMEYIDYTSKKASVELARVRGAFPNFRGSVYDGENPFRAKAAKSSLRGPTGRPPLSWEALGREVGEYGIRNATTTTIAPTGTISIICGASSGIEPYFSICFVRNVLDNQRLLEVNPLFEQIARERGFYTPGLMDRIAETGSVQGIEEVPEEVRRLFPTALEIEPEWHIRIQAAFQDFTDNATSKTVNCPYTTTIEDIGRIYRLAYELGCKGVTVYRDGSREVQVLTAGKGLAEERGGRGEMEKTELRPTTNGLWGQIRPVDRPKRLTGITDVKTTPLGNLYLTLNVLEGHPFELFAQIGKAGSDVTAFTEAIARLISLAFRCGVDPGEVAHQLVGIGGSRSVGYGPGKVRSVPDAIGQFIEEFLSGLYVSGDTSPDSSGPRFDAPLAAGSEGAQPSPLASFNLCPVCGTNAMVHVEGCAKCMACGYSEC